MATIQRSINIMVRLQGVAAARQGLRQVSVATREVNSSAVGGSAGVKNLGRDLGNLGTQIMRTGSNMQWLGRQLQFSFSIPILAAGVAAGKWAMDSEKAMVRVAKVYGDADLAEAIGADGVKRELDALSDSFTAMSNKFGVLREDVINVAGEWAAAGSSGLALAKSTELTMRAMILGEMEAEEATRALIAMQAQYKLSTDDLRDTLNKFNVVENETTTKMSDLITGFEKSASVARLYGVDVNHLAAMLTALIPATGGAAAAGNGLKTMMSRLMAPTGESVEMLDLLNIKLDDSAWISGNAAQRFGIVAKAFQEVSPAARAAAASILLSNWQVNRGSELIANINEPMSQYHKTLNLLTGDLDLAKIAQDELNAVLDSSPKKLEIMWNIMRNAMADVIQPLIPVFLMLAGTVARAMQAFNEAGPATRAAVGALLVFLAVIGPLVLYLAALQQAMGAVLFLFARFAGALFAPIAGIFTLLALPFRPFTSGASAASEAVEKFFDKLLTSGTVSAQYNKAIAFISAANSKLMTTLLASDSKFLSALGGMWFRTRMILQTDWAAFNAKRVSLSAAGMGSLLAVYNAAQFALLSSDSKFLKALGGLWLRHETNFLATRAAFNAKRVALEAAGQSKLAAIMGAAQFVMLNSNNKFLNTLGTLWLNAQNRILAGWSAFNAARVRLEASGHSRISAILGAFQASMIGSNSKLLSTLGTAWMNFNASMLFLASDFHAKRIALEAAGLSGLAATMGAAQAALLASNNRFLHGLGAMWLSAQTRLLAGWAAFNAQRVALEATGMSRLAAIFGATRFMLISSENKFLSAIGTMWLNAQISWLAGIAKFNAQRARLEAAGFGKVAAIFGAFQMSMIASNNKFLSALGTSWMNFNATMLFLATDFHTKRAALEAAGQGRIAAIMGAAQFALLASNNRFLHGLGAMWLSAQTRLLAGWAAFNTKRVLLEAAGMTRLGAVMSAFQMILLGSNSKFLAALGALWFRAQTAIIAGTVRADLARLAINARTWIVTHAMDAAGWIKRQAIHFAGWVKIHALNLRAAATQVAITAAGWAKSLAIAAAGMIKMAAIMSGRGLLRIWLLLWSGFVAIVSGAWKGIVLLAKKGATALLALLKSAAVAIIGFLVSPWGLAILAITGILYVFREQVATIFNRIKDWFSNIGAGAAEGVSSTAGIFGKFVDFLKRAFWALPVEVQNAMLAVVRVLSNAAKQVMHWLSYLNPFARHSPSLVDNVKNGMSAISAEFSALPGALAGPISSAYRHIDSLKDLTASFAKVQLEIKYADEIAALNIHVPQAVGSFRALMNMLPGMQQQLRGLEKAVTAQENVVKGWQARLDSATASVEAQEKAIAKLQEAADQYSSKIQDAQSKISDLSSAPLIGMRAVEDQMQANTLAQNKLRLEMLKADKAGGAYKSIEDRIAAINGELETAQSKRLELQMGGAGSEILGFYDDQIASLEASKRATETAQDPVDEMAAALAALEHEAEILNLEKAINFDPLVYEIEKLANAEKELSFAEVTTGIKAAQAEVARYQPMLDGVNQQIAAQEQVLSGLEAQKQAIQAQYDAEDAKLQKVKASYDELAGAIRDVESALGDIGSVGTDMERRAQAERDAIERAKKESERVAKEKKEKIPKEGELSRVEKVWAMSEGGDFDIPGGTGFIGREGGMGEQTADIEAFTQQMADESAGLLKSMDIFEPIKKQWNNLKSWLQEHIQPAFGPIAAGARTLFSGLSWGNIVGSDSGIGAFFAFIQEKWNQLYPHLVTAGSMIQRLFGDDFKDLFEQAKQAAIEFWTNLQPGFEALKKSLPGIAMTLGVLIGIIVVLVKLVLNLLINILRPVFAFLGDLISAILEVFSGVFVILEGIFTLDLGKINEGMLMIAGAIWKVVKSLYTNVVAIILGIWGAIIDTLIGVFNAVFGTAIQDIGYYIGAIVDWFVRLPGMIWDALKWLWNVIVDFFVSIWDEVVGHSIIPDLVNDVVAWFWKLPGMVWNALVALGEYIFDKLAEFGKFFLTFVTDTAEMWNSFWLGVYNFLAETASTIWNYLVTWFANLNTDWDGFVEDVEKLWDDFWEGVKKVAVEFVDWIWTWLKTQFSNLEENWNTFQDNIKTAWDTFWQNISTIGSTFMGWISSGIETGLSAVKGFFDSAVQFITEKWDSLKQSVATPVRFIIDTIINEGIIKGWNDLLDLLDLPNKGLTKRLGKLHVPGFERGGKIPGSATGPRDNMAVVDKYGRTKATIRAQEGIVREPAMRKLARSSPGAFEYINKYGALPDNRAPAFWKGGTMPTPGPVRPHRMPYYNARYAADMGFGTGSPIYAWNPGTVAQVMYANTSYGNRVRINHPGDLGNTLYAHMSRINVAVGQAVKAGEKLGEIGYSGNVRPPGPGGAHLHFEIIGGSAALSGGSSGIMDLFSKALGWITDKLVTPVRKFIDQTPGTGIISDTIKGTANSLLDKAVEKIKSLIPGSDDTGEAFVPGGVGAVPGLGGVTANTYAKAANIYNAARQAGHKVHTVGGYRGDGEHVTRRALDFMVTSKPAGDYISSYVLGNKSRFGLQHVIWWQAINSGDNRGWRRMADRGSWTQNHKDHPHVLFNSSDKALARGTNGARSGWHLVGEAGAELVNFGGGERVLKNSQTMSVLSTQIEDTINALKLMITTASVLAHANAATGREAALAARSIVAVRDMGRRADGSSPGGRGGSVQRTDNSSRGVNINNAEFIFPNVTNGDDAEAFMRNLEEYLRRKGS